MRARLVASQSTKWLFKWPKVLKRSQFYLLLITLLLTACLPTATPSPSRTTNTHSTQFSIQSEKITFLDEYLVLHSPVQATEFHIIYQDNATGRVPGPSDWSITAAIKIDPADVSLWTADRVPLDVATVDLTRWNVFLPATSEWAVTSSPVAWQKGNVVLVIYEGEGVILFWSSTMG